MTTPNVSAAGPVRDASDPMPVFTIKAQDQLAVVAVEHYRHLCEINGLTDQAAEVEKAIDEIEQWQHRHTDRVKRPDHQHMPVGKTPCCGDPTNRDGGAHPWVHVSEDGPGDVYRHPAKEPPMSTDQPAHVIPIGTSPIAAGHAMRIPAGQAQPAHDDDKHPDLRWGYGHRVRVQCTATGRYVVKGWALVVSAQDNSLFLDRPTDAEPWAESPVPSDDAVSGAWAVLTSSVKLGGDRG